jgi:aryl-alcohol dehydrogenase-like predicted oxidoreductase
MHFVLYHTAFEGHFMLQVDQRQLGASELVVPSLGIGIWSWGDTRYWKYGQDYTREDITLAYRACLAAGLNFFDTAELYGNGNSERLLGECMREDGRPIIIASKFAPFPSRLSARTLLQALDASLERLGVQQIDLYQIHWPYTFLNVNDLMDMLAQAVQSGKVRAVGVSNYSAKLMRKAHARLARYDVPLASNQVHYSLLHRNPESNGVLEACRELNVALIAYSPLEQGLLTGKYRISNPDVVLPGAMRSLQYPGFRRSQRLKMEPLLQTLETVGRVHDKKIGQVALNWLLQRNECVIPIPGAKNERQASENAGAIGWHLSPEEFAQIDQASHAWL